MSGSDAEQYGMDQYSNGDCGNSDSENTDAAPAAVITEYVSVSVGAAFHLERMRTDKQR